MSGGKTYLGDGLYASFDGFHVVLTAENGISVSNTVYLDDHVLDALERFIANLKQKNQETK